MARVITVLLLGLAMVNVAYGDLVRPCYCGPGSPFSCGPLSCGVCSASGAGTDAPGPC